MYLKNERDKDLKVHQNVLFPVMNVSERRTWLFGCWWNCMYIVLISLLSVDTTC